MPWLLCCLVGWPWERAPSSQPERVSVLSLSVLPCVLSQIQPLVIMPPESIPGAPTCPLPVAVLPVQSGGSRASSLKYRSSNSLPPSCPQPQIEHKPSFPGCSFGRWSPVSPPQSPTWPGWSPPSPAPPVSVPLGGPSVVAGCWFPREPFTSTFLPPQDFADGPSFSRSPLKHPSVRESFSIEVASPRCAVSIGSTYHARVCPES